MLLPSVASTYQGAEQGHVLKLGHKVVHSKSHRFVNHASYSDFVSVPLKLGNCTMVSDILCRTRAAVKQVIALQEGG